MSKTYYLGKTKKYDLLKKQKVLRSLEEVEIVHREDPEAKFVRREWNVDGHLQTVEFSKEELEYSLEHRLGMG